MTKPRMYDIASNMAQLNELTLSDLKSPDKTRHVAHVRQEAMAAMFATGHFNRAQIGRFFNRVRTTVVYALQQVALRNNRTS